MAGYQVLFIPVTMKVTSVTEAFWAKCIDYEQMKNYSSVINIIFPPTIAFALGQSRLFVDAAYVVSMERTNADLRQP